MATHAVLAAAVKHSPLLGDFLDLVVREQYRLFSPTLSNKLWDDYLDGCRGRDPDMPQWNESTRRRLRSSVFQMLAQAATSRTPAASSCKRSTSPSRCFDYLKATTKSTSSVASRCPHERPSDRTPEQDPAQGHLRRLPRAAAASATRSPSTSSTTRPKTNCGSGSTSAFLLDHIPKQKPGLRVKHVNLFDFVLDYLKDRKLLDKAIQMQREKGDEALQEGPGRSAPRPRSWPRSSPRSPGPEQHDLVLVSGVGSVCPLLRTHSLLNNLQPVMGETPLVLFYPGRYDQMTLKLFGKLGCSAKLARTNNYYRAFKLVP